MFASLITQIRRLPPWGRAIAWPFFWLAWLIHQILRVSVSIIAWMLKEMVVQAKAKAKKTIAPWLWAAVGLIVLLAIAAMLGSEGIRELPTRLFLPLLTLGIIILGLRVMVSSIWPMGKKQKKK